MKNHNSSPSLYPYLVAEMIEADPHGSTLEAIAFMTGEDLKQLKNTYLQRKRESAILTQARESEKRIFAGLTPPERREGIYKIELLQSTKNHIRGIMNDILFLFEHRLGRYYSEELRTAFDITGDDPRMIIIEYVTDDNGHGIIKKI